MKKKFNVALFILLLLLGVFPGIIYLLLHLTYGLRHRPGANGKQLKYLFAIFTLLNSLIMCLFVPMYAVFGIAFGIILLLLQKLSNKSKMVNYLYLFLSVAVAVVLIYTGFWAYFFGVLFGAVFIGLPGAIRANRKFK